MFLVNCNDFTMTMAKQVQQKAGSLPWILLENEKAHQYQLEKHTCEVQMSKHKS